MGAWGYKALESDEGLDVVGFIESYISEESEPKKVTLVLSELIEAMKEDGFFGASFDDIDFYFDNSAIALAELYVAFKHTGELDFDHEDEAKNLRERVQRLTSDKESINFLLRYLVDIKNEVPDKDGERELVELWKESNYWDEWLGNLNYLIDELNAELE